MAYTVEIYDPSTLTTYDITNRTRAVQITETLDSGVTSYKVDCRGISSIHFFHHLTVKNGSTVIITGVITGQSDRDNAGDKQTIFTCLDYGYFFTKRVVAESYSGKTASNILSALVSKYFTEGTGNNIDASTEIISDAKFTYSTLKDAVDYVLGLSYNWHYYIDNSKDFHFFFESESTGASITASKVKFGSLQVDYEGIDHYNRVWIVGNKQAAQTAIDVYYTGDSNQKYFGPLPYEPASLAIYFTPTGLAEYQMTIAAEGSDLTDAEAVYNAKNRTFYVVAPADGKLRCNFKPVQQFIEYFENTADKSAYGLMEKAVKNKDVTSKLEARRYARAEVQKISQVKRTLRFSSDHNDIINSKIGQMMTANITQGSWIISGNFLLKSIDRQIIPANNYVTVSVEMGEI